MKAKDGFMLRQFGDDYIAVAVGDGAEEFNKLITLNSVGAFIFETLREEITLDGLVEKLLEKYEVSPELARSDAVRFTDALRNAGMLDE